MKNTILFIGGCADDQRIPDPEAKYWKVTVPCGPDSPTQGFLKTVSVSDAYRRESIHTGEHGRYHFYVVVGMDMNRAFQKLLNGYKQA